MDHIMIAYWSGTGNTEAMAGFIQKGVKETGKEAKAVSVDDIPASELKDCSIFALGCPAMGDEVLEEGSMEPFVTEVEKFAGGKKIALFGSYDWGDGEWMRNWADRMREAGAEIINGDGLICNNEPDQQGEEECIALGKKLAEWYLS